jgi:hypothetical protein
MANEESLKESISAMVDEYKAGELSALFQTPSASADDTLTASLSAVFTRTGGTTDTKLVTAESTARKVRKRKAPGGDKDVSVHTKKAQAKEKAESDSHDQNERDARTLFVGNVSLAKGIKPVRPALFKHFTAHGLKVHSVRVRSVPITGMSRVQYVVR